MLLPSRIAIKLWVIGFAALAGGCGDDAASTTVAEVVPSIYISALRSSQGAEWSRASADDLTPAEVVLPCDGRLVASVVLSDFLARAPGACGVTLNCGHIEVSVVSDADAQAASETAAVVGPVLLELSEPNRFEGAATFTARLLLDDGSDYLTRAGNSVTSSLPAVFQPPEACPPSQPGGL